MRRPAIVLTGVLFVLAAAVVVSLLLPWQAPRAIDHEPPPVALAPPDPTASSVLGAPPLQEDVSSGEPELATASNLVLEPAGSIVVRAVDDSGALLADFQVSYRRTDAPQEQWPAPAPQPDGSQGIRPLHAGAYTLWVQHRDYPTAIVENVIVTGGENVSRDVTLSSGLELVGLVLDRSGHPVEEAEVIYRGRPTRTDASGHFRLQGLERGSGTLTAIHPRFEKAVVEDVVAGTNDLRIALEPGAYVAGRHFAGSELLLSANVFSVRDLDDLGASRDRLRLSSSPGSYVISNLTLDVPHTLQFRVAGFAPATIGPIVLARGEPREGVDVSFSPGAILEGRVTAKKNGKPIASASLFVDMPEEGDFEETPLESYRWNGYMPDGQTAADGGFRISGITAAPGSPLRLVVRHEDFVPFKQEFERAEAAGRLEIALERGAVLRGHAPASAGESYRVAARSATGFPEAGDRDVVHSTPARPDGTYEIRGLAPGSYIATLSIFGPPTGGAPLAERAFSILGEEAVTIDFDPESTLRVLLRGKLLRNGHGVEGCTLSMADGRGSNSIRTITREGGAFTLAPVSPGLHEVTVTGEQVGFRVFILVPDAAPAEHDIEFPTAELRVTVIAEEDGAPLAGARVAARSRPTGDDSWSFGTTSIDGVCRLANLKPGSYDVSTGASPDGEATTRVSRTVVVEVRDGTDNACEIRLPVEGSGTIRGVVRANGERHLVDGSINFMGSRSGAMNVAIARDGTYATQPIPEGVYTGVASVPGFAPAVREDVVVRPDETTEVDFVLTLGGSVRVRLETRGSRPLDQLEITVWSPEMAGPPRAPRGTPLPSIRPDASGEARIEHLAPGLYRLYVMDPRDREVLESASVTVREGEETTVTIVVP